METFKLIFFWSLMTPIILGGIAGLYLIVLCCIRDIRAANIYYAKKRAELEQKYRSDR